MIDSVIQFRGTIYENGYGLIAQKVMRDKKLPKQSKLIYAYMCSFAGVGKNGERTAFPSVSLQCSELGMGEDTYYRWRKYLVQYGYITIEKQKNDQGKFDRNLYIIEAVPVEVEMDETVDTKGKKPTPKNEGMEKKPSPKKSGKVKRDMEKRGTNINSLTINSFNKEEEEEPITTNDVMDFMKEQINKREITNPKTIHAIGEVASKCKAIGTNNRESMENYCIKVVEEKMVLIGQKQKQKSSNSQKRNGSNKKPIRTEILPDWFVDNPYGESSKEVKVDPVEQERKKKEMEETLRKLRS